MHSIDDADLSPDQRQAEIARFLAIGVRRLQQAENPPKTAPESATDSLDLSLEPRLSVHVVNGFETPEKGEPLWR